MTAGRLWWLLKRDLRRGPRAATNHYRTLPKIRAWKSRFGTAPKNSVPIHILTGENDWLLALWMLATFFEATEQGWKVCVHDDGTLPTDARATLEAAIPDVRVILRKDADREMDPCLKAFPFCQEYRALHPLALKVFDFAHFEKSDRYIILDSDLIFYRFPREIIDWCSDTKKSCWFNRDVADSALLSAAEAKSELGIELWSEVNSGLCLLARSAVDLDLCDRALAETGILRGHIWRVEQTLLALCASKFGSGGLLPKTYEVSLGKQRAPDAIARHYVGAVRDRFYSEGVQQTAPLVLP